MNGPGYSSDVSFVTFTPPPLCPRPDVDLRGFFLAELDQRLGWIWVAAYREAPAGTACTLTPLLRVEPSS